MCQEQHIALPNGKVLVASSYDGDYPCIKIHLVNDSEEISVCMVEYNPDRQGVFTAVWDCHQDEPAAYIQCD